jgi:hypothetical protein
MIRIRLRFCVEVRAAMRGLKELTGAAELVDTES